VWVHVPRGYSFTRRRPCPLLAGPGTYENDSSIGRQTLSNRSSGQRFGFGTVDRDMASRVFVSPTFAKNYHGLNSPGPAAMYAMHSQMTGPHYGFGTEQRGDHRHEKAKAGLPGPGAYDMDSTLGSQSSSAIPTAACFGFGSSNREQSVSSTPLFAAPQPNPAPRFVLHTF
jgi:hypothetical protein